MRTLLSGLLGLVFGFLAVTYYIGYQEAQKPALYSNGDCLAYADTIEIPSLKDTWFEIINPLENGTYKLNAFRNSWSSPTLLDLSRKEVETHFIKIDCPRQPIPGE